MADVQLDTVTKQFDDAPAVSDLSLDIADGEFVILLGPTGAGKTTTLRLVAGLERPDQGTVTIAGRDVTRRPPAERDVCFVFQQYSLYPHYTVFDNLAFPLRAPGRRHSSGEITERVREVAALLRIESKLNNRATQLSGGEMQRVAIGRALVRQPSIFLMDEPLSSLDAKLREDLRTELKRIQRDRGATILYAAHDQVEAMTLADRIGVLSQGRMVQLGSPRDIYERPVDTYVAQRLGSPPINLLPVERLPLASVPHGAVTVGVRPEDVQMRVEAGPITRVVGVEHLGRQTVVLLQINDDIVRAELGAHDPVTVGEELRIGARRSAAIFFDEHGLRVHEERSVDVPEARTQPRNEERRPHVKRFINTKETIVTEALDGLVALGGTNALARLDGYPFVKIVTRADLDPAKVAVVSGGGAGHEPAHAGFVGRGLLTAAISGEIFASPSVEAVYAGIMAVTGDAGCLLVVKNYTGDRLNFGLAAERAKAQGKRVETVLVADDVAIPGAPQPRGVAGTLFVHKIAGHLAEQGADLQTVAAAARSAAADLRSLGVSLASCTIPGQPSIERLAADEGELGLGIHGEPGVEKIALQSVQSIVRLMVDRLRASLPAADKRYAALINNLGAVPPIEMSVIAHEVLRSEIAPLLDLVIGPAPLMTSLDMNGFSLSLLELDDERRAALASSCAPAAWPAAVAPAQVVVRPLPRRVAPDRGAPSADATVQEVLSALLERLTGLEDELNALDARIGDGDTGSTFATASRAIRDRFDELPFAEPDRLLGALGDILAESMGGTSGVLLSIFCTAAGQAFTRGADWPSALAEGAARLREYGGADPGDRTMVDALVPGLEALQTTGDLARAADAARDGAARTAEMTRAKAGRASYLTKDTLVGVPDPGAVAAAAAFETARDVLSG